MNARKPPIGWRILKWLITLLTILYATQIIILPRLQPGVKYADQIHPFYLLNRLLGYSDTLTFLLDIVIAIAICVGLHVLIDKHCEAVANREKDAIRLQEESARFNKTAMRMTGATLSQQEKPTLTPIMEWCAAATKYVPKVLRSEIFVSQLDRLLERRKAVIAEGYSLDAAERVVVETLGDPEDTAQQLRKSARRFTSLLDRLEYTFTRRGWVLLYSNKDEQICLEILHILSEIGIEYRANQNTLQKNYSYMQAASMGGGNRSSRVGMQAPNIYNIASATTANIPAERIHSILVRRWDAALARRLVQ